MPNTFSFPPNNRLRKSAEFAGVQKISEKLYCKHFLILIAPGQTQVSRLGITVTTKIDKRAVIRNKIKRRIRHIFRLHRDNFRAIFDIVVIARKNAGELTFADFKRQLLGTLKHRGYLQSEKARSGKTTN